MYSAPPLISKEKQVTRKPKDSLFLLLAITSRKVFQTWNKLSYIALKSISLSEKALSAITPLNFVVSKKSFHRTCYDMAPASPDVIH